MTPENESIRFSHLETEAPNISARRAKIVCTIGPACSDESIMRDLLRAGMDVARLNFSHGTYTDHARRIEQLRRVARKEKRTICIMQDLQGPKIRTGRLKFRTPVALKAGSRLTITPRDIAGTSSVISTTFSLLAQQVHAGDRILLSDGLIELRVRDVHMDDVECEVINGGMLGEHKGINLPGITINIPAMTEKDEEDLAFGLKHDIDVVAASFIRTAEDIRHIRAFITQHDSKVPLIAKLEKPQAIEHLEEIFEVADGVMVARGDLGVELPPEKVPVIQKHIIRRAMEWRKPVITATQMLESMVENPRPTRAEASDVANAIMDGTDAVMLSAETASGKYPREAVTIMARIVAETESHLASFQPPRRRREKRVLSISETICESVAHAAEDLDMRAIAVFTETGNTARLISKYRPECHIFSFGISEHVSNLTNLYWGVHPVHRHQTVDTEAMVGDAEQELLKREVVEPGDVIGIVAGTQKSSGSTNFMRLHVIGASDGSAYHRRVTRIKPASKTKSSRKKR